MHGKTTATFHHIANGVHSKIVVPIHGGLVKLNDTLKISDKVLYTASLCQHAVQPIVNNSLVVAIGEKAKQLEVLCYLQVQSRDTMLQYSAEA